MRLQSLLLTAGLAVALAGTATAARADAKASCADTSFIAELICTAQVQAHQARTPQVTARETRDGTSFLRTLLPRSVWDWLRPPADRAGTSMVGSSGARPPAPPATTDSTVATSRNDGQSGGARSP